MLSTTQLVEIIGYIGSVLVAVSLMMSSIVKLRIINLLGAVVFSTYGFIIGALPVGFLNGFIALVDIYFLIEIFSVKEYFSVLELKHDSEYVNYFLKFHRKDIEKYMPDFSFQTSEKWIILFVLRNSIPAGLVCAEYINEESIHLELDYVIPGYRDFKIGKFVFQKMFREKNVKKIFSDSGNGTHEKYLKRMGFVKTGAESKADYCLEIN